MEDQEIYLVIVILFKAHNNDIDAYGLQTHSTYFKEHCQVCGGKEMWLMPTKSFQTSDVNWQDFTKPIRSIKFVYSIIYLFFFFFFLKNKEAEGPERGGERDIYFSHYSFTQRCKQHQA